MKGIFLICLLLLAMLPSGAASEPVILLTNSVDKSLNTDFIDSLNAERTVTVVEASAFENYKNSKYIVILGGNKAPEGVGDIVEKALSEQEKTQISKEKQMLIKLNLWQKGQVVVFFAGPERETTNAVCQENKKSYVSLLKGVETLKEEIITPDHMTIAFLWLQPVLGSDRISPYAPSSLPKEVTTLPYLVPYSLKENCWFFWVDDAPYAKYAHATRFVFFGIDSGTSTVYREEWWPVLNGKSLWTEKNEYWNTSFWVYDAGLSAPKPSVLRSQVGSEPALQETMRTSESGIVCPSVTSQGDTIKDKYLVVNGWKAGESNGDDMAEDEKNMTSALETMGAPVEKARTVKEMEVKLKNWAGKLAPGDTLLVYITAHGDVGYLVIGGEKFTVAAFAHLLSKFEAAVRIIVIIDASYAGSFLADEMKKEAHLIITATSADKCAYGDYDPKNDPNPTDKGSEFTSGFTEETILYMKENYGTLSPKDVYGRIFGKIEDVMINGFLGGETLDASALGGFSDPQLWQLESEKTPVPKYD